MTEPEVSETEVHWIDCSLCGTPIPYREGVPIPHREGMPHCHDCESLAVRHPNGLPPEVEAAILLSRTLRQLFADREGYGYRKSVISEIQRVADNAESVCHYLRMLEIQLKGIEDRLEEISDEAQNRSLG